MQSFLKSGKLGDSGGSKTSTPAASKKKARKQQWVEKYRPKSVEDVVEQNEAVSVLQECITGADLPNLLFYGPPGTGKTSTILAAARQLFGDLYKDRILELNASDERGIQVVRDKIKTFSQLTVGGSRADGKFCPALKIVILDEADAMTHAAQAALRRTMEKETKTTRFCLLCNYVSRIIEPLTSRCTKFRFKPLKEEFVFERLRYISQEEGVLVTDEVLKSLVEASSGDMRRAITALQSCANLIGKDSYITLESVYDVMMVVPHQWVVDLIGMCQRNEGIEKVIAFTDKLTLEAYPTQKILEQFNDILVNSDEFADSQKAEIGEYLSEVSFRSMHSKVDFIHLLDLILNIQNIISLSPEERKVQDNRLRQDTTVEGLA
ncbi:replication factor C subunit 4 [Cylas formicarius]|uniref:replication factor C subunit 4 n=1 Tax=Cylas formicarius TaxID=197179 RepID=UPI00295884DA|nr:replication factor C subunit 4 [Cylas formicarius]